MFSHLDMLRYRGYVLWQTQLLLHWHSSNFLFLLMSTEIFSEISSGVTEKCYCKQDGASKMTGKFCRKLNNELLTQKQRIVF